MARFPSARLKQHTAASHKKGSSHDDALGAPGHGVHTKTEARRVKRDLHETKIKVGGKVQPTRLLANKECGKGRGFACTLPRGHKGGHAAYHPPITRVNIPGKLRAAKR